MPYCPKCKEEYEEGVKFCKECNEELVNKLENKKKEKNKKDGNMSYTHFELIGIVIAISSLIIGILLLIFASRISFSITNGYFENYGSYISSEFNFMLYATYVPFMIIGVILMINGYVYSKRLFLKKIELLTKNKKC